MTKVGMPLAQAANEEDGVNGRERMMAVLSGQSVDRPPVWMMRQAGRTLPEYRALRAQHSFLEVMHDPALATEVTLQPIRRFGLDAAIIFCDILIVPAAMGQDLEFIKGTGPVLGPVVRSLEDVEALKQPSATQDYAYLLEALRQTRQALSGEVALLGFAGAPLTLASYMIEGGSTRTFTELKSFLFGQPDAAQALFERLADAVTELLLAQLDAGADAVQLFDTWAGELSAADYERFAMPYNRKIIERVRSAGGTIMLFLRNGAHLLDAAVTSGASGLALDWRMDVERVIESLAARAPLSAPHVIQGNLDPATLFAPTDEIRRQVHALHQRVGGRMAHIMNLGHGLHPNTPLEGIGAFVRSVQGLA